jgi:hypothetical protein
VWITLDRVETPFSRYSFEYMGAAIGELNVAARHHVSHGAGNYYLVGSGE